MRRNGNPLTDEQRKFRHIKIYGNSNLPPRGSGNLYVGSENMSGYAGETDEEKTIAGGVGKILPLVMLAFFSIHILKELKIIRR